MRRIENALMARTDEHGVRELTALLFCQLIGQADHETGNGLFDDYFLLVDILGFDSARQVNRSELDKT